MGVRTWLLLGLLVSSPACETTPEERIASACTVLCRCEEAPLPALQDSCITKCSNEIDSIEISDPCIECISANGDKCATLEDVCGPVCTPPTPVDDGGI